jgi:hypothetical protein
MALAQGFQWSFARRQFASNQNDLKGNKQVDLDGVW